MYSPDYLRRHGFYEIRVIRMSNEGVMNDEIEQSFQQIDAFLDNPENEISDNLENDSSDNLEDEIPDNIENEIEDSNEESNEEIKQETKRIKLDETEKENTSKDEEDGSDDQKCPICLDPWSNYGEHRLCSLRCGHLFGHSCIIKWFLALNRQSRRCPECNTKAAKKDIRILYAKKLSCIDTTEIEQMKEQLKQAERKRMEAEESLSRYKMDKAVMDNQMKSLQERLKVLEKSLIAVNNGSNSFKFGDQLLKSRVFEICNVGSCRVMAYNQYNNILVMSSKVGSHSNEHGFSKLYLETMTLIPSLKTHNNVIRDVAFNSGHPHFLLSVSFDRQVTLTDIRQHTLIHSYKAPAHLWSCCWSGNNTSAFYTGTQNGHILEYDIRFLTSHVHTWENTNDPSPVVSLAAIPACSRSVPGGGFLTCQLNSCTLYALKEGYYTSYASNIDGPFTSLRYDEKNDHALISCRANAKNPRIRQIVCSLEKGSDDFQFNVVHTFDTGCSQKLLSRSCYMQTKNDTLVVANNESLNSVLLWSVSTGKEVYNFSLKEPVVDTCSYTNHNLQYTQLAVLTSKRLHLYNLPDEQKDSFI